MALFYKDEHLACHHYSNLSNAVFSIVSYPKGEIATRKYLDKTFIAYMLEGAMEVSYGIEQSVHLRKGHIFLLPKNCNIQVLAIEDCKILLCSFAVNDIKLCSQFSIKQLSSFLPENRGDEITRLESDSRISQFASFLTQNLEEGLSCMHYHLLKRDELFLYLRAGYDKNELAYFFQWVLSSEMDFKDYVLTNYKNMHDVKEFALKSNMSLSTFNRRFKTAFNETAWVWLKNKKVEDIYNDIVMTNTPFNLLAEKYNFSSSAYFATFCKKSFGCTAQELRKEKSMLPEEANE